MSSVDYGFKKPSDFVGALVEWVNRNGGGIVPLTGAGISVTAGIPVLLLLEPYLRDCVIRSVLRLCTKGPKPLSVPAAFAWNPHDDPWPKLRITPQEAAERDRRMSLFTKHFFTEHYQAASNLGGDSGIVREAAGALADWRACLFFLSRLERGPKPSLGAGKTWIVDAFVRHFTANASPSLEHRMFAMLGDLLRIRISITTNFDNLTERASAEIGRLLEVYDVHQQAGMPPADTVHQAGPALIKVHGGRYGYRADYSLVEAPTADERRAFASYIAGRPIDPELWERLTAPAVADNELLRTFATDTSIPRALLVCGVGSKDKRILQLIESAVLAMRIRPKRSDEESGSPPFRVFWVAYSWADVKVVKDLAKDHPTLHGMITFTQERYLGLMLLELYQRLTGNVPPTAVEFPAMWRISTPPSPANPDPHWMETGEFEKPDDRNPAKKQPISASNCVLEATSQLFKAFEAMKGDRNPTERRLIRIVPEADESDAVTVAAYGFHKQLEDRNACIWIELDQVANPDELFERILQAMGKLIGDDRHLTSRATDHPKVNGEPIAPPDVDAREKDRLREFHHMANGAISRWRIFLYCTEGFGTSIDFNPGPVVGTPPSGWESWVEKTVEVVLG